MPGCLVTADAVTPVQPTTGCNTRTRQLNTLNTLIVALTYSMCLILPPPRRPPGSQLRSVALIISCALSVRVYDWIMTCGQ